VSVKSFRPFRLNPWRHTSLSVRQSRGVAQLCRAAYEGQNAPRWSVNELKRGYRRPAAASPAHYAKLPGASYRTRCLGFITSRLCIGWPRGDARGSFRGYSDAKRGASPLRLPACRAGQQCVSPPNRRPGPRSSRWGSVFPEAEQGAHGPPLVVSCCCFLSWRLVRHRFENRDVRLVCHQLLGVGDHASQPPGWACRGGSHAWPDKTLLFCHWLTIKHHRQAREDGKPII
jgi:hypothetical protein